VRCGSLTERPSQQIGQHCASAGGCGGSVPPPGRGGAPGEARRLALRALEAPGLPLRERRGLGGSGRSAVLGGHSGTRAAAATRGGGATPLRRRAGLGWRSACCWLAAARRGRARAARSARGEPTTAATQTPSASAPGGMPSQAHSAGSSPQAQGGSEDQTAAECRPTGASALPPPPRPACAAAIPGAVLGAAESAPSHAGARGALSSSG